MLSSVKSRHFFNSAKNTGNGFEGLNRRAVAFFPGPHLAKEHSDELNISNKFPLLSQIVRIEAQMLSGCIKLESENLKSRSAMLIDRGKLVAAVYGCKREPDQIFGQHAYEKMLVDFGSIDADVKGYNLPVQVVTAAAAMFHGDPVALTTEGSLVKCLEHYLEKTRKLAQLGSVVVLDASGNAICVLYVLEGCVIGINPLASDIACEKSLKNYITRHSDSRIVANFRTDKNFESATSLSNLGCSQPSRSVNGADRQDMAQLLQMCNIKPASTPMPVSMDRFISCSRRSSAAKLINGVAQTNPYRIDPIKQLRFQL